MKNDNESWDVLGDSRKRYRCPWAEIGKYRPGKEPIRLQDSLPCPLKKKKITTHFSANLRSVKLLNKPAHSKETEAAKFK